MDKATKREHVVKEILDTEEKYVTEMAILTECFVVPLQTYLKELGSSNKSDEIPIETLLDQHNMLFSNASQLHSFNEVFLKDMQSSFAVNKGDNIGHIFAHASAFFKMYSTYTSNYMNADKILKDWLVNSPRMHAFVRAVELQSRCHGLTLSSFLIMPVQRIPRYKMLLQELLKYTDNNHRDFEKLTSACQIIEEVARSLNNDMKSKELRRNTIEICEQFDDLSLLSPSRLFVKESDLQKICQHGKKTFKFALFNDMIMYGKEDLGMNRVLASGKKKHSIHRKFYLKNTYVVPLIPGFLQCFMLVSNQKSFFVDCGSAVEKNSWIACFEEVFRGLKDKLCSDSGRKNLEHGGGDVEGVEVWGMEHDEGHMEQWKLNRAASEKMCGILSVSEEVEVEVGAGAGEGKIGDAVTTITKLSTTRAPESNKVGDKLRRMSRLFHTEKSEHRDSIGSVGSQSPIPQSPNGVQDGNGGGLRVKRPSFTASEIIDTHAHDNSQQSKPSRPMSMSVLGLPQKNFDNSTQISEKIETISIIRGNNGQLGLDIMDSIDAKGTQNGVRVQGCKLPSSNYGIRVGERISVVNGAKICNVGDFQQMVEVLTRNNVVKVGVVRHNGALTRPAPSTPPRGGVARRPGDRTSSAPPPMSSAMSLSNNRIRKNSGPTYALPPAPPTNNNNDGTADLLGLGVESSSNEVQSTPVEKTLESLNIMSSLEFLSLMGVTKVKFEGFTREKKEDKCRELGLIEQFEE